MYLWHSCLWHAEISREPWVIHYTAESSGNEKLQNKTENSRSDLKTAPSYNRANSIMMDTTSSRNLIAQNWTKINQTISYIFLLIAHKYFFTNCSEINVIQNKWFIIIQTNSVLVPNLYFQIWASNFGIHDKALGASVQYITFWKSSKSWPITNWLVLLKFIFFDEHQASLSQPISNVFMYK